MDAYDRNGNCYASNFILCSDFYLYFFKIYGDDIAASRCAAGVVFGT